MGGGGATVPRGTPGGGPVTGPAPLDPLPEAVRVAVVVPAWRSAVTLRAAVASALQPLVEELVIAVDPQDHETFREAEGLAGALERVRLVPNPGGRTPDGLNAGIRATAGEVVVRVDAHSVLPANYVARAVATLRATGAANVGGRQVPVAERWFERGVAAAMTSRIGAGGAAYRVGSTPGPAETVYLGTFRRDALERVGGYDARMTRNQDAELNLRLVRAGYLVWFDPGLAVTYRPRDSVRTLARQYLDYGRWRRMTSRLHPGSMKLRQLAPPVLVAGLLVTTISGALIHRPWLGPASIGGYVGAVWGVSTFSVDDPVEAVAATVALTVMHTAWGVGFLLGPPRGAMPALDASGTNHG